MENNWTTLMDEALFLEVPVQRIEALIENNQILGVVTGPSMGFVQVDDVLDLAEV